MNKEARFVIIGKERCGYCDAAKKFLKAKNEDYKYYDSGNMDPDELSKRLENLRIMTFPVVFHEGKYIGGFSELSTRYKELVD